MGTGFYKYCNECFKIFKVKYNIIHEDISPGDEIVHGDCLRKG
jgi:hypothetical protein